ncbi:hypothetical protein D3C78_1081820 [compost metagenome]
MAPARRAAHSAAAELPVQHRRRSFRHRLRRPRAAMAGDQRRPVGTGAGAGVPAEAGAFGADHRCDPAAPGRHFLLPEQGPPRRRCARRGAGLRIPAHRPPGRQPLVHQRGRAQPGRTAEPSPGWARRQPAAGAGAAGHVRGGRCARQPVVRRADLRRRRRESVAGDGRAAVPRRRTAEPATRRLRPLHSARPRRQGAAPGRLSARSAACRQRSSARPGQCAGDTRSG